MGGEPARPAKEPRLRDTIRLLTMPTAATRLAGIGRVHVHHWHTGQPRLVGNERAQLRERPTVQHSPLALGTVDATADALKVLKRDSASCVFRRADNGLAETVVDILAEASLASTALLQEVLARRGV